MAIDKKKYPLPSDNILPRASSGWKSRINALKISMGSGSLYERGVSPDRLARERLEKQLEKEKQKSEILLEQIRIMEKKYSLFQEEFRKVKEEAEHYILFLMQKSQAAENEKNVIEKAIAEGEKERGELLKELENAKSEHAKSRMETGEFESRLSVKNAHLEECNFEILKLRKALEDRAGDIADLRAEVEQAKSDSDKRLEYYIANKDKNLVDVPTIWGEGTSYSGTSLFGRIFKWLNEPITAVSFRTTGRSKLIK